MKLHKAKLLTLIIIMSLMYTQPNAGDVYYKLDNERSVEGIHFPDDKEIFTVSPIDIVKWSFDGQLNILGKYSIAGDKSEGKQIEIINTAVLNRTTIMMAKSSGMITYWNIESDTIKSSVFSQSDISVFEYKPQIMAAALDNNSIIIQPKGDNTSIFYTNYSLSLLKIIDDDLLFIGNSSYGEFYNITSQSSIGQVNFNIRDESPNKNGLAVNIRRGLLSIASNDTILHIDLDTYQVKQSVVMEELITGLNWDPNGSHLAVGTEGMIHIFNTNTGDNVTISIQDPYLAPSYLQWNQDSTLLGYSLGVPYILDVVNGLVLYALSSNTRYEDSRLNFNPIWLVIISILPYIKGGRKNT